MKSSTSVSVETKLLEEVRRGGINLSQFVEDKLAEHFKKPSTPEEHMNAKIEQFEQLKREVYIQMQLKPDRSKKLFRDLQFKGMKTGTLDEKIAFYEEFLKIMRLERIANITKGVLV